MAEAGTYESTDLVLAATLQLLHGVEGDISRRGNQVVWAYTRDERLTVLLQEFHSGKCLVEPVEFAKMLRLTRNKVYGLMNYDPPRVQPLPATS